MVTCTVLVKGVGVLVPDLREEVLRAKRGGRRADQWLEHGELLGDRSRSSPARMTVRVSGSSSRSPARSTRAWALGFGRASARTRSTSSGK